MILPTIYDATLDGIAADAKIGAAIASASERIAIDEAPTVTLNILDPSKELLRSRLWSEPREAPLTLKLGDRSYGLVQVDKQQARELRLVFEQIEVLKLRAQQGYIKAYRSRTTRLAFCARLCREAGVDFHAPESGPNAPEFQPASGAAVRTGGGFDKGAGVTVKHAPASAAQLKAMETVLGVVFGEHAPERAAIAVVMAVTGESVWNPRAGLKEVAPGELSRGSHLGLFQQSSGYTNPLDPATATKEFLHGSAKPGGPKSAFLDIYRANLSSTTTAHGLATLIHSVQRPNETADQVYTPWYEEASRTVAAFARPGPHRTLLLNDKFEFSRGQPHRPETSWDALGRILSEIGWRRFMVGRTLWATSDEWLMATPARATLTEDTGAVETISWSLDVGKPVDRASVAVDNSWVYAPGVTIRLEDEGPATGKWLLAAWERDLLGVSGTLSLVKPGRTIPEPVGDQSGKGYKAPPVSTATPGTGVPGGVFPKNASPELAHSLTSDDRIAWANSSFRNDFYHALDASNIGGASQTWMDERVLLVAALIIGKGYHIRISSAISTHPVNANGIPGNPVSNHKYGGAFDIDMVSGVAVSIGNSAAHELFDWLHTITPTPEELLSPWADDGHHGNHIHCGFKEVGKRAAYLSAVPRWGGPY